MAVGIGTRGWLGTAASGGSSVLRRPRVVEALARPRGGAAVCGRDLACHPLRVCTVHRVRPTETNAGMASRGLAGGESEEVRHFVEVHCEGPKASQEEVEE